MISKGCEQGKRLRTTDLYDYVYFHAASNFAVESVVVFSSFPFITITIFQPLHTETAFILPSIHHILKTTLNPIPLGRKQCSWPKS